MRQGKTKVSIKNRQVWEKTDGRCWYCGTALLKPDPKRHSAEQRRAWYTIDHATPRSRGGSLEDISNLLPCCNYCNGEKCDMTLEEYREYLTVRQHNIPYYSKTQLEYLTQIGVNILEGLGFIFWGERIENRKAP